MTTTLHRHLGAILVAMLALTALVRGQDRAGEQTLLRDQRPIASIQWRAFPPPDRKGGFGFVEFRVVGRSTGTERVSVKIDAQGSLTDPLRFDVEVEPGQSRVVTQRIPAAGSYLFFEFQAAGSDQAQNATCSTPGHHELAILFISGGREGAAEWKRVYERIVGASGSRSRGAKVDLMVIAAKDLPDDWRAISAMDLVVFDGEDGAESRAQRIVHDYALAGGNVVLLDADGFATGPLDPRGRGERFGFGRVVALTKAEVRSALVGDSRAVSSRLAKQMERSEIGPAARIEAGIAAPIPAFFDAALAIPGTEPPPMQLVLVLIGAFALLVGPINSFLFRNQRGWLLITVPAAGILATGGILAWGLLGQGLGTREVEQSFSIHDQERGLVTTLAQRSLFVGSAVPDLAPRPRTWLWNLDLSRSRDTVARWIEEADGRIDGSFIPSRTITNLAVASLGELQGGLRIRRTADDFRVDDSSDLEPIGDRLLVRLPDGRYLAAASDKLAPIDEGSAERLLVAWEDELIQFGPRRPNRFEQVPTPQPRLLFGIQRQDLDGDSLPRGSYFAVVKSSPGRDDLGLAADESSASHAVLGFLGQKDIRD
ncbi:MAG: hypothetical protein AB7I19_06240 [Planctomycetota bacterium]